MKKKPKSNIDVVENYFQNIIKNSWTWDKLTEEERKRFTEMKNVFEIIKGSESMKREWIHTIYKAFLYGVGYDGGLNWRLLDANSPQF